MKTKTSDILFDEDYTGPRFTYGLRYRPLARFAVPDGWIIGSNKDHPEFPNFGIVDYPFELSDKQLHSYELKRVE